MSELLQRVPRTSLLATGLLLAGAGALGQTAATVQTRSLAATCAACHGTDGKAVEGQAMARLAGLPADDISAKLRAFRDGSQPATVMHQIAKGYSNEQIDALATWFAGQK